MVSHPPLAVAMDEAVAPERNDHLPGDAGACPFRRLARVFGGTYRHREQSLRLDAVDDENVHQPHRLRRHRVHRRRVQDHGRAAVAGLGCDRSIDRLGNLVLYNEDAGAFGEHETIRTECPIGG